MSAQGTTSIKIPDVGRFVMRDSIHYEFADIEVLALKMLQAMVKAGKEGRPLSDGFLLQKRIHRQNMDTYLENNKAEPEDFGVIRVERQDLTFTKK